MERKTYSVKKNEVKQDWYLLDASDQVLGRLATKVATLLTGKDKPRFTQHINVGDKVVIVNCEKVKVTGKKLAQKMYYSHSGYPGGLKQESLSTLLDRDPKKVLWRAIHGMLPINKLRNKRMLNLYLYEGGEHPHKANLKYAKN